MTTTPHPRVVPHLVIRPPSGWAALNLAEVWQYREMVWLLTLRDIKSRYKQTLLGPVWIVLMPLLSAVLFSIIFGGLAGLPSGEIPYPVFVYCGMIVWGLFTRSLSAASNSLLSNQHLITKVYFPRLIAPIAGSITGLLDFLLGCAVLSIMMVLTGISPTWTIVAAPFFAFLAIVTGVSLGLWIAASSIRIRDLRHAGTFLTQIGMWATPVVYSTEIVLGNESIPEKFRTTVETLFQLNPLFVFVEGFRWSLLGHSYGRPQLLNLASLGLVVLVLIGGMFYFRRVDSTVADVI